MTQVIDHPTETTDAMDEAAFAESFREETGQKPTDTPATTSISASVEAPTVPIPEASQEADAPKEEPAQEYVQLTKAEHGELLKIRELQHKLDQGFGTLGNIQQTIRQLQESRTTGKAVEVTDEDLAELKAEFPEFAELTKKALSRVLARVVPMSAPTVDTTAITQAEERTIQRERAQATATLDTLRDDWRDVTGTVDESGKLPDNAYYRWLATKPADYQRRLLDTWNPHVIAKSIETFTKVREAEAKPKLVPPKANERTTRLTAAVTPKGVAPGGAPPEESGFASAFNEEQKAMNAR